jgi:hypothetical protein
MALPGFTADAAIYSNAGYYRMGSMNACVSQHVLAQGTECPPCVCHEDCCIFMPGGGGWCRCGCNDEMLPE